MMKKLLANLQPRERLMVLSGIVAVILMILYLTLWAPYSGAQRDALRDDVASRQADLAWMQQAAQKIRQLQQSGAALNTGGQSLLALIDQTAKQNQIGGAVKRIEPAGEGSVRVWLEQADFDALLLWVDLLQRAHGIAVDTIALDREPLPGRVNARITFSGGAA
jgi:general secretion pathway protein M